MYRLDQRLNKRLSWGLRGRCHILDSGKLHFGETLPTLLCFQPLGSVCNPMWGLDPQRCETTLLGKPSFKYTHRLPMHTSHTPHAHHTLTMHMPQTYPTHITHAPHTHSYHARTVLPHSTHIQHTVSKQTTARIPRIHPSHTHPTAQTYATYVEDRCSLLCASTTRTRHTHCTLCGACKVGVLQSPV